MNVRAGKLKTETVALCYAYRDSRTPWYTKQIRPASGQSGGITPASKKKNEVYG